MKTKIENTSKPSPVRLIRLRDIPRYLGMNKNSFNAEVRPLLVEIPIGKKGIAFDKLDLDDWVDHYKECNGRPTKLPTEEKKLWDVNTCQALPKGKMSGISTKSLTDAEFMKALDQVIKKKQNVT